MKNSVLIKYLCLPLMLIQLSVYACFSAGAAAAAAPAASSSSQNTASEQNTISKQNTAPEQNTISKQNTAPEQNTISKQNTSSEQELLSLSDDPVWSDADALKAIVISDLHYRGNNDQESLIVPGISMAEEITDAIIAEVIDRQPDVLIMTGDNTDGGKEEYVSALTQKLQTVRDADIEIILTTGNHDYDRMDAEGFEKAYFGLLDPVDRDPASLSYSAVIKDVVFLAMDDNALHPGEQGEFSAETMQWIGDMLEKYRENTVIFLSHHNVLYGYGEEDRGSQLIQNPDLPDLLAENGVKLAMTGHMHFPYVSERKGLWEILIGMPFSEKHLIGNLAVGKNRIVYYAGSVDFDTYGSSIKDELYRLEEENGERMDRMFSGILENEGVTGRQKTEYLELINRYFQYYGDGTLAEHAAELKEDPSYEGVIEALSGHNYGKWMEGMIETTKYNSQQLVISW